MLIKEHGKFVDDEKEASYETCIHDSRHVFVSASLGCELDTRGWGLYEGLMKTAD